MAAKKALITGVTGQDGTYLAKLLLEKGYAVTGGMRRSSHDELQRHRKVGIDGEIELVDLDLTDVNNVNRVIQRVQADEVYNLAAHSFVGSSWDQPLYVNDVNASGVVRLLDSLRSYTPGARFYQASTSEMFGRVREVPQTESTPLYPRSPYGVAKVYGHFITVNYRESFDMHATSGILFNHESPLRGTEFVTRKITRGLASIKAGSGAPVKLGNVNTKRDWGFAGDYVEGMWRMLQQPVADDYVLATGVSTSIREFIEYACEPLGYRPEWNGSGIDETCTDAKSGTTLITVDAAFYRPAEVEALVGDASKANKTFGWSPQVTVRDLAAMMVESDLAELSS